MKRLIVGIFIFVAVFVAALFPKVAQAASFTYDLDVSYGAVDSDGLGDPWLRATFDDSAGDGTISLHLETGDGSTWGIATDESVKEWYFNGDDSIDWATFAVIEDGATGTDDVSDIWGVVINQDGEKAGGDGFFDFKLTFPEGSSGDSFFGDDEDLWFTLSDTDGLTLADFSGEWSVESGGFGPYLTAAHIQSTGDGTGSDWVAAVPEPSTVFLLGSGLVGLALYGRKRFRKETDKAS